MLHRAAPGRPPKLSNGQKRLIPEFLWHGPEAYGFSGQIWTRAGIALVIEEEFGVRYHPIMSDAYSKNCAGRSRCRSSGPFSVTKAIESWRVEVWPELLRRAKRERRHVIFEDESGLFLLSGLVRTYDPEGRTPIIREKQTRDHLSVMGGMTSATEDSRPSETRR